MKFGIFNSNVCNLYKDAQIHIDKIFKLELVN